VEVGKAFAPSLVPLILSIKLSSSHHTSGFNGIGACLLRGVSCIAEVGESNCFKLNMIHGEKQLNIPWIERAAKLMLRKAGLDGLKGDLIFNFEIPLYSSLSLPVATLISALASIYSALKLSMSPAVLGDIAHEIELKYKIGLGVSGIIMNGGITVVTEPGAPSMAKYLNIRYPEDLRIVVGGSPGKEIDISNPPLIPLPIYADSIPANITCRLNEFNFIAGIARRLLHTRLCSLSLKSRSVLKRIMKMNPLMCGFDYDGKTVFAVVERERIRDVIEVFLDFFPCEGIIVSEIDPIGARVYF